MKTRMRLLLLPVALVLLTSLAQAQTVQLTADQYESLKIAGKLPKAFHMVASTLPPAARTPLASKKPDHGILKGGGGQNGNCNCWVEPDNSYTEQTNWPLGSENFDDGSAGPFALPFSFNLYGDLYTSFYLNINGNVSFGTDYNTYSPDGFPNTNFTMVAPFWADVQLTDDTQGSIKWKVTDHALYVNWTDVGYFNVHYDKRNTFQLIITDGTDPSIGIGNTVSFCYKDMQWTTGDASDGVDGFGGFPAVVGANRGNGTDFIQFGTFDQAGAAYDGPFGANDGIDWLDSKAFVFNSATSTQNIAPITSSNFLCDTVKVCMNQLVQFDLSFLTPEGDQAIINAAASAPDLPPFAYTVANNVTSANIHVEFIPTLQDTGFHVVTFTAQDNGPDSLTTTISITLEIFFTASPPPTITGDTVACEGVGTVLTAGPGYDNYIWTNGYYGQTILVGPGTYLCTATAGDCRLASNYITVTGIPNPEPTIVGATAACGGIPSELATSENYASYQWSNGSTDPGISAGTGSYSVTVTDANGCVGTAPDVTVFSPNNPIAQFSSSSPANVFPGTTVTFTNTSNANGTTIVNEYWTIDSLASGSGDSITYTFNTPGNYLVTLTVTTSDGCTGTLAYYQLVVPTDIVIPNVFSPNGDSHNDALTFTNVQYYNNSALKVFNRWGQVVYENANYKNTWTAGGVPEGTYFFVLKMESGKEYTGNVTLLR